ncbi:SPOR domain-containing protein [Streptomyces xiangluensis]|uniref:SPOR domain-containing protein n=1 Tax=Streptomyces xiangluensis TaxID=2665720 RepID=A0ABV8YMV8_9ACTN
MSDSTITLPWLVVRRDDNGNRYTVSRCATRVEAEKIAGRLEGPGPTQLYLIECIEQNGQNGSP